MQTGFLHLLSAMLLFALLPEQAIYADTVPPPAVFAILGMGALIGLVLIGLILVIILLVCFVVIRGIRKTLMAGK